MRGCRRIAGARGVNGNCSRSSGKFPARAGRVARFAPRVGAHRCGRRPSGVHLKAGLSAGAGSRLPSTRRRTPRASLRQLRRGERLTQRGQLRRGDPGQVEFPCGTAQTSRGAPYPRLSRPAGHADRSRVVRCLPLARTLHSDNTDSTPVSEEITRLHPRQLSLVTMTQPLTMLPAAVGWLPMIAEGPLLRMHMPTFQVPSPSTAVADTV